MVMVKLTVRRPMTHALSLMTLAGVPLILLGTGANALWLASTAFAAGVAAECDPALGSPEGQRLGGRCGRLPGPAVSTFACGRLALRDGLGSARFPARS